MLRKVLLRKDPWSFFLLWRLAYNKIATNNLRLDYISRLVLIGGDAGHKSLDYDGDQDSSTLNPKVYIFVIFSESFLDNFYIFK